MKTFFQVTALGLILVNGLVSAGEGVEQAKEGMEQRREGAAEIISSPANLMEDTAGGLQGGQPVVDTTEGVISGTAGTAEQALEGAGGIVEGTENLLTAPLEAIENK